MRVGPRYPYSVWGVYQRTLDGVARTNNAAEGLNNAINRHFEHAHPSLYSFIDSLSSFHLSVLADLRDLSVGKQVSKTNSKWAKFDEAKLEIVKTFDSYIQIGDYLAAIGSHIML